VSGLWLQPLTERAGPARPTGGRSIRSAAANWLGRQDSQPVFLSAKSLILFTQKTRFTSQMYSGLAQFFKALLTTLSMDLVGLETGFWRHPDPTDVTVVRHAPSVSAGHLSGE
jgi:hypothetical protein